MKKLLFIFLLFLILFNGMAYSQQNRIDSLLILLKTDKADTNKLNHLNNLSRAYDLVGETANTLLYANDVIDLCIKIRKESSDPKTNQVLQKNEAFSYNTIGLINYAQGNFQKALKSHLTSLRLKKEINDKKGVAASLNNIGNVYTALGNFSDALEYHINSLKIKEELNDKAGIAASYNNIGNVYYLQKSYPEALKNYMLALDIRIALGNKKSMANSYNNIGIVFDDLGKYDEAIKNLMISLKIKEEIFDKFGIAETYNNIAELYSKKKNYPEALKYHLLALKINQENGFLSSTAASLSNIGDVYLKQKNFKDAEKFLLKAKKLSKEVGEREYLRETYMRLSVLDSAKGDYKDAYENHKMYILYRDSLDNEETRKKTIQSQMTYDFEKKEAVATAEHKKELENQEVLAEEKSRKQKAVIGFVGFGLLLVLVFAGFIFRTLRVTRKQKTVIEEQKEIVEHQKVLVEEKQKEIVDSITYAKRIQYTLLANKQLLDANLPEHFVLFKPKDIVSGDFYWATKKVDSRQLTEGNEEKTERFYVAACDSTGHGVPGAFMSLLNISFLNEAVNEKNILEPHEILNHVRKRLIENMDGGQDGMDCILLCIERSPLSGVYTEHSRSRERAGVRCTYAAANNSPTLIQNGKLISLEADKMPVGKGEKGESFTLRTINLIPSLGERSLYLYTDGYADQFGGPKGKKFKYKQLDELLVSIADKPCNEQSEILNQRFEDWKGDLEQVDDMLVIGIKI